MGYKKYNDEQVTEAIVRLAINKYDYEKTAEQVGISSRTIKRWSRMSPKKGIPELLDRAIERMLMVVPENWSGSDWAIALGILIDKWLLIQGEPTIRTESVVQTFEGLTQDERDAIVTGAQEIIDGIGTSGADEIME